MLRSDTRTFWALGVLGLLILPLALAAESPGEQTFQLTCADGFVLDGKVQLPVSDGTQVHDDAAVERVILLIHGSGPQSMDVDMTSVTKGGQKNLFFKDLSDALSASGFAVVRYNKRSYQMQLKVKEDAAWRDSEIVKAVSANPLKFFVDDAKDAVAWATERFSSAEVYLLGHSQGTYIALQAAHQLPTVRGVALLSFYSLSLDTVLFEQVVHRPQILLDEIDLDHNQELDDSELEAETLIAGQLKMQKAVLDIDGNGTISYQEVQAGNLSNILLQDPLGQMRLQEAQYPRVAEILQQAGFAVAFFQGMLDNQTQAYHAMSIDFVNTNLWKKDNFSFTYFPGLGHSLDARDGFGDLQFGVLDDEAKQTLVNELSTLFVAPAAAEESAQKP